MSNTTLKIRFGFAVGLVLELGIVALSYRTTIELRGSNRLVAHANETITNLEGTVEALNNLERSRLAWVMAGTAMHNLRDRRSRLPACGVCHGPRTRPVEAEHFRDTHLEMIADLTGHIRGLEALVVVEPAQRERLLRLESLVEKKAALAKVEIPSPDAAGFDTLQGVRLQQDSRITDEIQGVIADMKHAENKLLAEELREENRRRAK